jgi:hypothetical protein
VFLPEIPAAGGSIHQVDGLNSSEKFSGTWSAVGEGKIKDAARNLYLRIAQPTAQKKDLARSEKYRGISEGNATALVSGQARVCRQKS